MGRRALKCPKMFFPKNHSFIMFPNGMVFFLAQKIPLFISFFGDGNLRAGNPPVLCWGNQGAEIQCG